MLNGVDLTASVCRLNAILESYQTKFGALEPAVRDESCQDELTFTTQEAQEPKQWLVNRQLLSPLMLEYDKKLMHQAKDLELLRV